MKTLTTNRCSNSDLEPSRDFGVRLAGRPAPDLMGDICRFLGSHPGSPTLTVAHHMWQEVRDVRSDVHFDSWVWIKEQLEALERRGVLERRQQEGAPLWSLAAGAPAVVCG
jgi:hypothetical protein